jgi:type IV secretion system protein VirB9
MKSLMIAAALGAAGAPPLPWRDGAVYAVATRPGRVTDLVLQPGEALGPVNPVAAGDTVRWIIGDSESGTGAGRQVHVLVKPVEVGLETNLVIATDRRTYHLELKSTAGPYMPTVAWRYPEGELVALRGTPAPVLAAAAPPCPGPDLARLDFGYRLEGDAPFRPLRVFDDGRRTVIDLPPAVAHGELPPLFVLGPGGAPELVNVRVQGARLLVDRLFDAAELRLGAGKRQARVRILRDRPAAP